MEDFGKAFVSIRAIELQGGRDEMKTKETSAKLWQLNSTSAKDKSLVKHEGSLIES